MLLRSLRHLASLIILAGFANVLPGCAHRENKPDLMPFDQRLANFEQLHNAADVEALKSHFTTGAVIQTPLTPRGSPVASYLQVLKREPYQLRFSRTEIIYSQPDRVATASTVAVTSPGRFNLKDRVTIDWRIEDGHWRIARMRFVDWPSSVGIWRKGGLRREGSIELRILPDRTYVIYLKDDYELPAFRGVYRMEGNRITFTDTSSSESDLFDASEGSYVYVRTPTGIDLRKIDEEHAWRRDRFDGPWSAAR